MKQIIILAMLFAVASADAQEILTPNGNVINKKWLTNQSYQMAWYAVKDTMRFELSKAATQITVSKDKVIVVTSVSVKQSQSPWTDSTIASAKDLSPVYHSSYNAQRDMVLNFGQVVKGYYNDKINNSNTIINDTTTSGYFDSNLYPTLISWLPLNEGYKQDIAIYDYKPGSKTGILKASIHDVKKGSYKTEKSGVRNVWVVTVSDEIGGAESGFSTYYIDVTDRRLWKQEIDANGRKMEMVLIEI